MYVIDASGPKVQMLNVKIVVSTIYMILTVHENIPNVIMSEYKRVPKQKPITTITRANQTANSIETNSYSALNYAAKNLIRTRHSSVIKNTRSDKSIRLIIPPCHKKIIKVARRKQQTKGRR